MEGEGAVVAELSYSYNSYIDKIVHDFDLSRVRNTLARSRMHNRIRNRPLTRVLIVDSFSLTREASSINI
jgi:hypothetical protein